MKPTVVAIFLAVMLASTGSGVVLAEPAAAAEADHLTQAREQANAAVKEGAAGHAQVLVEDAQKALEHVKMAQKQKSSKDLDAAVKSLEESIKLGKSGNADKATEHAKEALEYLDAAKAAMGG